VARGQSRDDGTFAPALNDHALGAAVLGLAESMIRERVIAQRTNAPNPFTDEEIRAVFDAVMNGVGG